MYGSTHINRDISGYVQEEVMSSITSTGLSGFQPSTTSNAKLQDAIARLVGLPGLFPTTDSVTGLSTVARLQAQNADIRRISGNIVQALSLSQVAGGGVSEIQSAAQQLQALAQQAQSSTITDDARASFNDQFQQLVQRINTIAQDTNFNGASLLNGSLSGDNGVSLETAISGTENSAGAGDLSIGDLSASSLFGADSLNLLSSSNASDALNAISNALNTLAGTNSDIGVFQQALGYASANVETVLANQTAAESSIQASDEFNPVTTNVQQNVAGAVAAQTSQLSPALLQLVS